jgi:pheromone shutdown protein TraB
LANKITILGTVHVFDLRDKVRRFIIQRSPQVVCVELDEERYRSLVSSPNLLSYQEIIARLRGAHAGDDMRGAIDAAKETSAQLVMMDKSFRHEILPQILQGQAKDLFDLRVWLRKIVGLPFITPAILARLACLWLTVDGLDPTWMFIKAIELEPQFWRSIEGWMSPNFTRAICDEREDYMANILSERATEHDNIIAVTGLLHLAALKERLSRRNFQVEGISASKL